VFRTAVLAALLAGAPLLARSARAQRSGSIRASAVVTQSVLGARLRSDSVAAAPAALSRVRRLRLPDVGVVEIQSGPGQVVRVRRPAAPADGESADRDVIVLVAEVGS